MPRTRILTAISGVCTVVAFVVATVTIPVTGSQATVGDDAAHTVDDRHSAAYQPAQTRVSPVDRSDAPKHRATPWTPLSYPTPEVALNRPAEPAAPADTTLTQWHGYDQVPLTGRAPPR